MVIAPAINTGTFGVAPQDAGVASATVTVGQMLGGSIGTSLLNTIFASAVASYLTAHLAHRPADRPPGADRAGAGPWLRHPRSGGPPASSRFGTVVAGALLRRGPLVPTGTPSRAQAEVPTAQAETGPALCHRAAREPPY